MLPRLLLAVAVAVQSAVAGVTAQTKPPVKPAAAAAQKPAGVDEDGIARILGKQGVKIGDVYKVSQARTDLRVTVDGASIKADLALVSWCSYRWTGKDTFVRGSVILAPRETDPVISALLDAGFQVTALHSHLMNATPDIKSVQFQARGDALKLAEGIRVALARTATPYRQSPPIEPSRDDVTDAEVIQKSIGMTGTLIGDVLAFVIPRSETIEIDGVELPPSMGTATEITIQLTGRNVLPASATGAFVVTPAETDRVVRALRANGFSITALHNHMLHSTPEVYYLHFWGRQRSDRAAAALKAVIAEWKKAAR